MLKLRYDYCLKKEKTDPDLPISVMSLFKILYSKRTSWVVYVSVVLFWMFVVLVFFINNKTVFRDVTDKVD